MVSKIKKSLGPICVTAIRLLAGLLLTFTSGIHMANGQFFLASIFRYELFSKEVAVFVAFVVPILELVLAALLISGMFKRVTFAFVATLFFGFAFLHLTAIVRGLNIDCGCFGTVSEHPVSWATFSTNVVVGLVMLFLSMISEETSK